MPRRGATAHSCLVLVFQKIVSPPCIASTPAALSSSGSSPPFRYISNVNSVSSPAPPFVLTSTCCPN